jgi:hypothetical protein
VRLQTQFADEVGCARHAWLSRHPYSGNLGQIEHQHGRRTEEGRHDLVFGNGRPDGGDCQHRTAVQPGAQVCPKGRAQVRDADVGQNDVVDQRHAQQNRVKAPARQELAGDELPVAHRQGHQHFQRAFAVFFGQQTHGQQRRDQEQQEGHQAGDVGRIRRVLADRLGDVGIEQHTEEKQQREGDPIGNGRTEIMDQFALEDGKDSAHLTQPHFPVMYRALRGSPFPVLPDGSVPGRFLPG